MKKTIASFLFIFFCMTLFAQEEVTFNFSSKKSMFSPRLTPLYVNGTEVTKLKNGGSFSYKASLDVRQPVTVMVKNGFDKREITFALSPGNKCNLEISHSGNELTLFLLSGGKLTPGTGSKSNLSVNKKDLSISYTSEMVLASDTIRLKWLEKGGKITATSYVGGATFLRMSESGIKMTGIGGQFVLSERFLNFRIPEYKPGIRTWNSFVLGFSETAQLYGNKTTIEIEGMDPMTSSFFTGSVMFSLDIGYTIGFGKFKNETKWKGVAFELTYRPSIIYSQSVSFDDDTKTNNLSINWTGFSFDVNFNNFTSNASKLAPRAQSKFSFFLLPPIKKMPLFITVGYGLTFYSQRG